MSNCKKYILVVSTVLTFLISSCAQKETVQPVRKNIEDAVFASGYTEQENSYTVAAKVDGIIVKLPIKEGDSVTLNDLIATIENEVQDNQLKDAIVVYNDAISNASPDSPQLQHLQTQIDQAQHQLRFDEANYIRYKSLWEKNSISKFEFEKVELQYQASQNNLIALQNNYSEVQNSLKLNVERNRVQVNTQETLLEDYQLRTKTSGKVIQVYKKKGEMVRRGEAIAKIGSGDYVIKLFVSEDDITKVELGQSVAIHINTYPGDTFQGIITKIYPGFDELEQSYIVESQFEDIPNKMFSGTQLQANIKIGSRENVLVVPSEYVSRGNYILLENGQEKQVVTGSKNNTWTEVVSGITEKSILLKPKT